MACAADAVKNPMRVLARKGSNPPEKKVWQEDIVSSSFPAKPLEIQSGEQKAMQRKIMIIDDDKEFLEELNETLTLSGYEAVVVNDATSALDVIIKTKPDVILLDLKMPKKSGFQVASELKYYSGIMNVPIIAMTGFFREEFVPLMTICGIKKYLKKPINPLDVIAQIEAVLVDIENG